MTNLTELSKMWFWPLAGLAIAVGLSLVLHKTLFTAWRRIASRTGNVVNNSLVRHAERPTRWIFPLFCDSKSTTTTKDNVRSQCAKALKTERGHKRSGLHVTKRYRSAISLRVRTFCGGQVLDTLSTK